MKTWNREDLCLVLKQSSASLVTSLVWGDGAWGATKPDDWEPYVPPAPKEKKPKPKAMSKAERKRRQKESRDKSKARKKARD